LTFLSFPAKVLADKKQSFSMEEKMEPRFSDIAPIYIVLGIAALICLALWRVAKKNNTVAFFIIGIGAVLVGIARIVIFFMYGDIGP